MLEIFKPNYNKMLLIGTKKYYLSNSMSSNHIEPDIYTDESNYYLLLTMNDENHRFLEKLISVAYKNYHSMIDYSYGCKSEAAGAITRRGGNRLYSNGRLYIDYFKTAKKYTYTTPKNELTVDIVLNEDGKKYVNIETWANALGFSVIFDVDDVNEIVYISAEKEG
ncbi:hypothetical protein RBH29_08635 [Herbivorax sp. ANBcel31]|uniref:hypothetical protein n=1 Tax=Herbivorax sp. ANBcel31 TaxID=3069754 RepID=UPI0027B049D0|nr:hypothetical protein [Herbivorax sp. ANBcel31]MDQ2086492.1 hypothetical protein [Herbivorax sp. ANBcel31]